MTVTKESLREALEMHEARQVDGPADTWRVSVLRMADAARFTERLLPGPCEHDSTKPHKNAYGSDERYCTGQLWDEGLVEAIAEALHDAPYNGCDSYQQMQVRAVLAALASEVGK